jgi:hypothetical protein
MAIWCFIDQKWCADDGPVHSSKPLQVTHGHGHNLAKVPKYDGILSIRNFELFVAEIKIFFLIPSTDQNPSVFPLHRHQDDFLCVKFEIFHFK